MPLTLAVSSGRQYATANCVYVHTHASTYCCTCKAPKLTYRVKLYISAQAKAQTLQSPSRWVRLTSGSKSTEFGSKTSGSASSSLPDRRNHLSGFLVIFNLCLSDFRQCHKACTSALTAGTRHYTLNGRFKSLTCSMADPNRRPS